jgi:predicted nucleic acid-binding protein
MRVVLDTSILIADAVPANLDAAISAVSIGELHFGLLAAPNDEERARRAARLGAIEERFAPLPVDGDVARAWGGLAARVRRAGAQPRTRNADLLIAATAQVHGATLLTHNAADFQHVADVVRVLHPADVG